MYFICGHWVHGGNEVFTGGTRPSWGGKVSCDEQGESENSCKEFHPETCCYRIDQILWVGENGSPQGATYISWAQIIVPVDRETISVFPLHSLVKWRGSLESLPSYWRATVSRCLRMQITRSMALRASIWTRPYRGGGLGKEETCRTRVKLIISPRISCQWADELIT